MKVLFILSVVAALVGLAAAIEFDLPAAPEAINARRCLSQWLPRNTHVKVAAKTLPGFPGQKINMEIHDDSPHLNQYGVRKQMDEVTFRFDTQAHANVIVCFQNVLEPGYPSDGRALTVDLTMDSGAMAEDFHRLQQEEKLKPMEIELRRLAMTLDDIQDELQYLKQREGTLRDASENMNGRVKTFSFFSIAVLIGVAVYQVFYLRHFFQQKKLI
ncbi:vesicle coat component [Coemansia sp. RSA 1822]|nr:vesicle coat component [Coemansia sp. RSA 638]KAJ2125313.1 vesicle coat component [Coemansia sp. RSA 720]KAJ2482039.1 vesicle coat component [Coemansia sp. RSA 2131]KAJ2501276.1 vesicle coat component [Coemansia sp. RSA 1972]KAJ2545669.1 vesicle coat component [Coemansia sp. RSA 1853]KAJ2559416.1 vesicle coat component [Coemansia sp. RSA 1822]KAJ2656922.1 vesicle coat component [Coemansia sp. RSA 1199]